MRNRRYSKGISQSLSLFLFQDIMRRDFGAGELRGFQPQPVGRKNDFADHSPLINRRYLPVCTFRKPTKVDDPRFAGYLRLTSDPVLSFDWRGRDSNPELKGMNLACYLCTTPHHGKNKTPSNKDALLPNEKLVIITYYCSNMPRLLLLASYTPANPGVCNTDWSHRYSHLLPRGMETIPVLRRLCFTVREVYHRPKCSF